MLTLRSRTVVDLELVGYDGLAEMLLFKGASLPVENRRLPHRIKGSPCRGLPEGRGPVLLDDASFTLDIAGPACALAGLTLPDPFIILEFTSVLFA